MSNLYGKNNMDKIIDEKLLHQWNKKYPPTEREKRKNIQIFKLQGNKNPFIS
jgi:endonuclease I